MNGLATLEALSRLGKRAILLEQFALGHDRGSSHGAGRIARSTYHDPHFARLMRTALDEDWPRLERDAGERLLLPTPGCIFGPEDGEIAQYERACIEAGPAGEAVRRVDVAEAKRLFPALELERPDPDGARIAVLADESAAVVAARDTMKALARLARGRGAEIREHTRVLEWTDEGGALRVETDAGPVLAERLVVCAGAWTAKLVPRLAPKLCVLRQIVGYFAIDAPDEVLAPGRFPVWIRLGRGKNEILYGLPQFESAGIKLALHRTSAAGGPADDPDQARTEPVSEAEASVLREFLDRRLALSVRAFTAGERCLYTMTEREEFVIERLEDDPRVVVAAGFSGHGFKFAPTTGRMLAELCV